MVALHKWLEKMMQTLLHKIDPNQGIAGDEMQAQASSAKLVDTSKLTSTMAEAKTVPLEHALLPLLNVVSIVDVPCPSALLVCSDVIKDVALDATMNKAAYHGSVTTDIITVVEEILHKDGIRQWSPTSRLTLQRTQWMKPFCWKWSIRLLVVI